MTNEETRQKRIEYIEKVIYRYTTTEPKLSLEEIAFSVLFHLDGEQFLKEVKKEVKREY